MTTVPTDIARRPGGRRHRPAGATAVAFRSASSSNGGMPNHLEKRRSLASWLLTAGAGMMLSGCVAAVVPLATGGMVGKTMLKRLTGRHAHPQAAAGNPKASPSPAATPVPPAPDARRSNPQVADKQAVPPVVTPPPPRRLPTPAAPAEPSPAARATPIATTWDGIARSMARMAARTPDPLKADVLQGSAGGTPVLCGSRRAAVAIDTATLGSGDALYVGALYTMGLEIVLMSPSKTLPPSEVKALAKQGIATPVAGKTLFLNTPGAEDAARAAITRQYCVIGLVGDRAADFPGGVLPGAPTARDGWFLVPRH